MPARLRRASLFHGNRAIPLRRGLFLARAPLRRRPQGVRALMLPRFLPLRRPLGVPFLLMEGGLPPLLLLVPAVFLVPGNFIGGTQPRRRQRRLPAAEPPGDIAAALDLAGGGGVIPLSSAPADVSGQLREAVPRVLLAKQYSTVEVLDRDTLLTFVEKIEVGPKILPDGYVKAPRKNAVYQQSVKIYYKFIGCLHIKPLQNFPQNRVISEQSEAI